VGTAGPHLALGHVSDLSLCSPSPDTAYTIHLLSPEQHNLPDATMRFLHLVAGLVSIGAFLLRRGTITTE
jgi:hypothetical protein